MLAVVPVTALEAGPIAVQTPELSLAPRLGASGLLECAQGPVEVPMHEVVLGLLDPLVAATLEPLRLAVVLVRREVVSSGLLRGQGVAW